MSGVGGPVIDRLNAALEGRYRIERELGQGGMATVFLAEDVKHKRQVALKVLKPELAAVVGGDRFLTEIETTANLTHPNILPLFDSGEADSFLYYVMPYVEGESLRDRLDREKQMGVDDAVRLAREVAEALHHAHGHGVVHRDVKPANILLQDGRPVVADFGIALAVSQAGGGRLTETGLSMGTPHYMSPEQASGDRDVDPRTDIYSLGCVLFEMLTGEPPYGGGTAQAVLARILTGEPDRPTEIRGTIPRHVEAVILKSMEKLPADRFESAEGFARALGDPGFRHGAGAEAGGATAGRWRALAVGAGAVALLLAAALAWSLTRPAPEAPVTREVLAPFADGTGYNRPLGALTALAPDGSSMVYARVTSGSDWELVLKRRGASEPTPLPGTELARVPTYSPDGREIAWVAGQELKTRPVDGGSVLTLARDVDVGMAAVSWADDGTILYERDADNALMQVSAAGGEPRVVRVFGDTLLAWSHPLPGSATALLEICPESGACASAQQLVVIDLATGELSVLADEVLRGWWVDPGYVVFVRRDGTVLAAPFDPGSRAFTGTAVPLFQGVRTGISYPEMVLGRDGTVVYIQGGAVGTGTGERVLVWQDRDGTVRPVDPEMPPGEYLQATLSPDGRRAAVIVGPTGPGAQLWVKELPDGPMTRLTNDPGYTRRPEWSLDGRSVAYITRDSTSGWHVRSIPADGSSLEYEVLLDIDQDVFEIDFTPDGRGALIRWGDTGSSNGDIGYLDLATDSVDYSLLASSFNEFGAAISPDGRWIAYVSDVSGRDEVFVRPMGGGARTQVSTEGGLGPLWSRSGRELFYYNTADNTTMAAELDTAEGFRVTSRQELFTVDDEAYAPDASWRFFDVSTDDSRFLVVLNRATRASTAAEEAAGPRYILIRNWFSELESRMDAARGAR